MENLMKKENKYKIPYILNSRCIGLKNYKHLTLFLIGFLGLTVISLIVTTIIGAINGLDYLNTTDGYTLITLISYFILFCILILILFKDNLYILKSLINPKEIFLGLVFAGLLISITSIYNAFIFNLGITSNLNQATVEEVALNSPFFSFIILGIIGPICEELTYRVGLFGIIRKYNRLASYIASSVIFGLLHFSLVDFTLSSFINELLNLPSYIISGLILTIAYEKGGFTSCIVAHMFNNILSMYYILFLG